MVSTFVDTGYLVAIAHERDQWHAAALAARKRLGSTPLVTTDEVLVEFLAAFSSAGRILRRQAAKTVRDILKLRSVTVAPQSRESFLGGLERYESRSGTEGGFRRFHHPNPCAIIGVLCYTPRRCREYNLSSKWS